VLILVATLYRSGFYKISNFYNQRQFKQLLQIARRHQVAIAIGHPYPETYRFLKRRLPQLQAEGIELVGISALLPQEHQVIAAGVTAPAIAAPQEE